MPRYVDAENIEWHTLYFNGGKQEITYKDEIDALPTADVAPVVHAHWIVQEKPIYISSAEYPLCKPTKPYIPDLYTCSMCGRKEPYPEPYCHCGAKMDEKEEEGS